MKKILVWLLVFVFIFQPIGTNVAMAIEGDENQIGVFLQDENGKTYGEGIVSKEDNFYLNIGFKYSGVDEINISIPKEIGTDHLNEILLNENQEEIGTYEISDSQLKILLTEGSKELNGAISVPARWNQEVLTDTNSINLVFTHTNGSQDFRIVFEDLEEETAIVEEEIEEEDNVKEKAKEETEIVEEETEVENNVEDEATEETQVMTLVNTTINENILTGYDIWFEDEGGNKIDTPGLNADIRINYTWALPNGHGYTEGAMFEFMIPEQFHVYDEVDRLEMRFEGDIIGYFSVNKAGEATIEFTSFIEEYSNINGTVGLWTEFREDLIIEEGKTITVTPIEGKDSMTIPIDFRPSGQSIEKRGEPNRVYNAETIDWTVDFNKSLDTVAQAVLSDPIQEGQSFVDGSIKLYYLDMQFNGTSSLGKEVPSSEYTISGDPNFSIEFNEEINRAYRLVFTTTLTDDEKATFENKALLLSSGTEVGHASASVGVGRGTPLDKRVVQYDGPSQTIEWEVQYNYDERSIAQEYAFIEDSFTDTHRIITESVVVKRITIDENGNEIGEDEVDDFDLKPSSDESGFRLEFLQDIDAAYKITYKTEAKDRVHKEQTISNTVTTVDRSAGDRQEIGQYVLSKSHGNVNYKEKTVDWQVRFNTDGFEMENVSLNDVFTNSGLKLDFESLLITSGGQTWKVDEDYRFNTNEPNDFENQEQFNIEFLRTIEEEVLITYKTEFDYEQRENKKLTYFENEAQLLWTVPGDSDNQQEQVVTDQFTPGSYTRANGFKGGSYNAIDKEITWNIGVNYNLKPINQLIIEDTILGNQQLLSDTIQIYEMTLNSGENAFEKGSLVDSDKYKIELVSNEDVESNQFTITFNDPIDTAYLVTYKTSLNGLSFIQANYVNEAVFSDSGEDAFELKASVSVPNGGSYTNKHGQQSGRFINWQIGVNYAQAKVENARVVDQLTENQLLLEDSFVLYETTVEANGHITKGDPLVLGEDYNLEFKEKGFELTFNDEIDRPYVLEYRSFIQAMVGETISNDVSFNGEMIEENQWSSTRSVRVARTQGVGEGSGELGALTVIKVDAHTNETLEGATFSLRDADSGIVISTQQTNNDGEVTFNRLLYGNYELREDNAPDGYVVGITDTQPVHINGMNTVTIANEKITRHVELTKLDTDTKNLLGGATFKLERDVDGQWIEVGSGFVTNDAGTLLIEDLEEGNYRFVEIEAPTSYILDDEPLYFSIEEEQTTITKIEKENERMNPLLTLIKTSDVESVNQVGDEIIYSFEVENTGNVTITDVSVDDPMLGGAIELESTTLAPGEKTIGTSSYIVTQEDLNNESVVNIATVTGESPDGSPIENEDEDIVSTEQSPSIGLIKASDRNDLVAGEEVVYTFTAQNTGNVTLFDVSFTDELKNLSEIQYLTINGEVIEDTDSITLEPGSVLVAEATYTITQADVDRGEVYNEATVKGESNLGERVIDTDEVTIYEDPNGSITLTKASDKETISQAADEVIYTFTVENTGNVTLTDVSVDDPMLGGVIELETTVLAPGEVTTGKAVYVVTQANIDNGILTNVAAATGETPDGAIVKDTDDNVTPVEQNPAIHLLKEANRDNLVVGEDIEYTFIVENTGNVTLTDVVLTDELENLSDIKYVSINGEAFENLESLSLTPGDVLMATAIYTITQADVDRGEVHNEAIVIGLSPSNEEVSDKDDVTVEEALAPGLSLTKTSDLDIVKAVGQVITYTFEVQNEGNVTLTNVSVDDPMLGEPVKLESTTLAPGEKTIGMASYIVTQEDLNRGSIVNIATVTGESPDGTPLENEDGDTVLTEQSPAIELTKTADRDNLVAGERIVYSFKVENVGNVTLSDLSIIDELENISNIRYTLINGTIIIGNAPITLQPGDVLEALATYTITQADVDRGELLNTAKAVGKSSLNEEVTDEDEVTVAQDPEPEIKLIKSSDLDFVNEAGTEMTYTFEVENTGNVTLEDVQVTDPMLGGVIELENTKLAPGEKTLGTAVYKVTQTDVNHGEVVNNATTIGTTPGGNTVEDEDEDVVPVEQNPSITLSKEANRDNLVVGEDINYTFTVENTGNVTLTNVILTDELKNLSDIKYVSFNGEVLEHAEFLTLAPGDVLLATATYTITQADVDRGEVYNEATVIGLSPSNEEVSDEDDVAIEQALAPDLLLTKTSDLEIVQAVGDVVMYTFEVENTGNVTIANVSVDDPMLGGAIELEATTLAPGEKTNGIASYTVKQEDLNNESIVNIATVKGNGPDGSPVENEGEDTVPTKQTPAIGLIKAADRDNLVVGEDIVYTFTAQNVGNVTLFDVLLTDELKNLSTIQYLTINGEVIENADSITLEPGSVLVAEAIYTITQEDIDRGEVYNEATIVGESNLGERVTDKDEVTIYEDPNGSIVLTKTSDKETISQAGDEVTYTFTVENTGNVTLTDVNVNDPMLGGEIELEKTTLAPGETTTGSVIYVVTEADLNHRTLDNIAYVVGHTPDGKIVKDDDVDSIQVDEKPSPTDPINGETNNPKTPEEGIKDSEYPKGPTPSQETGSDKPDGNDTLVQTANNLYVIALAGLVLLAIGIAIHQINRKRKRNTV
ncbi:MULTISPECIES: DUF7507 domain-containing protein [Bacillaceae]|uniref:DUF7507 domain-containing protein n=1 Tax=Shouchella oshimensis TaxID=290588 RepID=UPI0006EC23FA|nr:MULTISPECIES: collagen binding domain-containing protein [Bacillaceae]